MRQRLGIAQAIMEKPDLLTLDEPTNGFDEQAVELFQKIIAEEKARGATCLIATHQKDDIKELCTFAHSLNKRVYVTTNIIPHDDDLKNLDEYLLAKASITTNNFAYHIHLRVKHLCSIV